MKTTQPDDLKFGTELPEAPGNTWAESEEWACNDFSNYELHV